MHRRLCSIIPGLYPLNASSTHPPHIHDSKKMSTDITKYPLEWEREQITPLRTTVLQRFDREPLEGKGCASTSDSPVQQLAQKTRLCGLSQEA